MHCVDAQIGNTLTRMNRFGAYIWEQAEAVIGHTPQQQEVAELIGVRSSNTIRNWSGDYTPNIDADTFHQIADAFNVPATDVFRIHEESLAADLPKGSPVTMTRTTPRQKLRPISKLRPRTDRPTI
jgi:transcriptional regulator with XRE-family HTH domain